MADWKEIARSHLREINHLQCKLVQKQREIDQLEKVRRQAANVADMANLAFQGWMISKDEMPAMVALFGALSALRRRLEQAK